MGIWRSKGCGDLDDKEKIKRLYQWCEDNNSRQNKVKYTALYVKQEDYERYTSSNFAQLVKHCRK